jgi:hypothetical protein
MQIEKEDSKLQNNINESIDPLDLSYQPGYLGELFTQFQSTIDSFTTKPVSEKKKGQKKRRPIEVEEDDDSNLQPMEEWIPLTPSRKNKSNTKTPSKSKKHAQVENNISYNNDDEVQMNGNGDTLHTMLSAAKELESNHIVENGLNHTPKSSKKKNKQPPIIVEEEGNSVSPKTPPIKRRLRNADKVK